MRHIMVAIDGSSGADRAIDTAIEIVKAVGGTLSIVTISGNLSADEIKRLVRVDRDIGDVLESLCVEILKSAEDRARHNGISDVKIRTGWGDPAEAIINLVKSEAVDMVVLGRRGRGQLMGLLLGSVSQKVVSLAPCIVAVVP